MGTGSVPYSPIPGGMGLGSFILQKLGNDQVGRYRAGASGYRRNGQRRGSAFRVTHRQNRVGGGGFYNGHANDLGAAGIPACYGVSKIRPIEGKDQLPGFGGTNLEQHLISADVCQVERIRAKAGNAPGAVRAVLGEADIRPGGDGSRIVRGHQGIEIGIGKYATSRALRPNRASFSGRTLGSGSARSTNGTLRTGRTGFANRPLRTSGTDRSGSARCADGALRTSRTSFTNRPLRASRADRSGSACSANGTLRAGRASFTDRPLWASGAGSAGFACGSLGADRAGLTGRALRADRSGYTGRALRSGRASNTGRTLRANGALFTGRALGANRALYAGRALGSRRPGDPGRACRANAASLPYRPLRTNRAGDPRRTLHTGRTSWPGNALWAHRTSGPNGTLGACRTLRTHRALGVNGVLGHIGIMVAAASIKAAAAVISLTIAWAVLICAERIVILIPEAFVSTHSIPSFWVCTPVYAALTESDTMNFPFGSTTLSHTGAATSGFWPETFF